MKENDCKYLFSLLYLYYSVKLNLVPVLGQHKHCFFFGQLLLFLFCFKFSTLNIIKGSINLYFPQKLNIMKGVGPG